MCTSFGSISSIMSPLHSVSARIIYTIDNTTSWHIRFDANYLEVKIKGELINLFQIRWRKGQTSWERSDHARSDCSLARQSAHSGPPRIRRQNIDLA